MTSCTPNGLIQSVSRIVPEALPSPAGLLRFWRHPSRTLSAPARPKARPRPVLTFGAARPGQTYTAKDQPVSDSNAVNAVQFGRMMAVLETTREELARNREEMSALNARLSELEGHWSRGRASIIGLMIGLGFTVLGIKSAFMAAKDAFTG